MPDLWPFVPRIAARDVLSFQTDIRKTQVGEARDSLRAARRIVEMEFTFDDAQSALAESMFRAGAARDWLVPLWPEMTQYPMPKAAGVVSFAVEFPSDYKVGEFALLAAGEAQHEMAEISAIGSGSVTILAPSTIEADAIAPLRVAYFVGGLGGSRLFRGMSIRKAEFAFRADDDIAETPYAQYLGADLVTDPSVISSPIDAKLTLARGFIDNGSGPVVIEPMRDIIDGMSKIVHKDFGRAAMVRRKRWFRYLRGRDRSFWLPTWADDLAMTASATGAQVYIDVAPLYGDPAALVGRHIIVDDGNGYLPREITAAVINGGVWRLTIAALGRAVGPDARVMFLNRMRLDADRIEMTLTGAHYMEAGLPAVEVSE